VAAPISISTTRTPNGIDLPETAAAADAGIADDVFNRGVLLHDGHHLAQLWVIS